MMHPRRHWRRFFFWLAVVVWVCPAAAAPLSAQDRGGLPVDLQALIAEALKANPEVKQTASLHTAAKEQISPAGALDDPELSFSIKDLPTNTWSFSQDDMTQKMFMLSQKVPFPGKRRLRSEVAASQAQSDAYAHREKANEIRARVVMAYWGLALADAGLDLTRKNKETWEQVVQVAETRYGVGQGMQADVLQAQVELGSYLDRLLLWQQRRESIKAELNALRAQPPQTPLPRPQPLKSRPFPLKLEELFSLAAERPQLQALKALVAKQEKAVDLAKKDYYPDFTLGLGYGLRENREEMKRSDMFTSTFMVNLPIWHAAKIKPRIREEQARRDAAQEAHQGTLNQLQAAVKDRHSKLQRLAQQVSLVEQGILPQARQAAAATLAAYQVGAVNFAQLYQSRIAVYNTELMMQEYLKDFEENWAELEWLVGRELPRLPGRRP